jgi:hypothetical protein
MFKETNHGQISNKKIMRKKGGKTNGKEEGI